MFSPDWEKLCRLSVAVILLRHRRMPNVHTAVLLHLSLVHDFCVTFLQVNSQADTLDYGHLTISCTIITINFIRSHRYTIPALSMRQRRPEPIRAELQGRVQVHASVLIHEDRKYPQLPSGGVTLLFIMSNSWSLSVQTQREKHSSCSGEISPFLLRCDPSFIFVEITKKGEELTSLTPQMVFFSVKKILKTAFRKMQDGFLGPDSWILFQPPSALTLLIWTNHHKKQKEAEAVKFPGPPGLSDSVNN